MRTLVLVLVLALPAAAAAVTHTLRYFHTASSGIPNFPEFVSVGMVDGLKMIHYDSNTKRAELKQDWMNKVTADDPQYLQRNTQNSVGAQQIYKVNIEIAKQRFNQTGGVHIFQNMYGCEWDDETDQTNGFYQFGFDGEDFIAYDLQTETWIAPRPEAVLTKQKWDHSRAFTAQRKHYLTQTCIEWLKKYLSYGRSSLMRTELPTVSLIQKTSSSPVSCLATGFYPDRASLMWRREGEELHEEVEHGELLPNHDGTFQLSVDLDLSSVAPEDWSRYDCVFQLAGVEEDKVTRLDKDAVQSNRADKTITTTTIITIIAVVTVALAIAAGFGFVARRWKQPVKDLKSPLSTETLSSSSSDSSTSSSDSVDSKTELLRGKST